MKNTDKTVIVFAKKTGLNIIKKILKHLDLKNTFFFYQGSYLQEIKKYFKAHKIPLTRFSNQVKKNILKHKNAEFSWLLNLWGGEIFTDDFLKKFRNTVNVHPSYLPYGKGRDPIVWALIKDEPLGFSFHKISKKIDSGKIYYRKKIKKTFLDTGGKAYKEVIKKIPLEFAKFWQRIKNRENPNFLNVQGSAGRINKRADLLKEQIIDFNKKTIEKKTILKLLAFDFSSKFCCKIKYKNQIFSARLRLRKINE